MTHPPRSDYTRSSRHRRRPAPMSTQAVGLDVIDILTIRDRLNEIPFRDGKRQVFIGCISDQVDINQPERETDEGDDFATWCDSSEVAEYLQQVEDGLHEHNLSLARSEDDPDVLYAVQLLRQTSEFDFSGMADAMNWVSRITAVAVLMIGLGIFGLWLDNRFGTYPIEIVAFLIGVPLALWYLIVMTK